MALTGFAFAVKKRPAPARRRLATSDRSQPGRTSVVQTSPPFRQHWRSRLQSQAQSQLSLGSIISLLKQGGLARRGASLQAESDLRHPLHFNAADEVSCRAGAIKCSRCRASFAPIRPEFSGRKVVPPLNRLLTGPLSETKNWRKLLIRNFWRQANQRVVFTSSTVKSPTRNFVSPARR